MECCSDGTYQFATVKMESSPLLFVSFIFLIIVVFILRTIWIINSKRTEACATREGPIKTMIVVGSGGHTMEMLQLLTGLSQKFTAKIYVIAETDGKSLSKVLDFEKEFEDKYGEKSMFEFRRIPRSREVGQSYITSIFTTFLSSIFSFFLVLREKPDLILCNGPGTCVPICLSGFLMKVLMVKDIKTVYIESICRVKTLSLSAKILYYFVDRLIVQWPYLYNKYQRAVYLGRIV